MAFINKLNNCLSIIRSLSNDAIKTIENSTLASIWQKRLYACNFTNRINIHIITFMSKIKTDFSICRIVNATRRRILCTSKYEGIVAALICALLLLFLLFFFRSIACFHQFFVRIFSIQFSFCLFSSWKWCF